MATTEKKQPKKVVPKKKKAAKTPKKFSDRFRRKKPSRPLNLPSYRSFTAYVCKMLWSHRKLFICLVLFYAIATAILVGLVAQDIGTLSDSLSEITSLSGVGQTGLLFVTLVSNNFSPDLTEAQQIYTVLICLLTWLTTVWLLRNIMAGHKVKLRDGLYNAAAPIISTFLVALVLLVQLLPAALGLIAYSAALSSGLLSGGIATVLFWLVFCLLILLSIYWITSTFIALVVVTLPGIYPLKAIRTANGIVSGRRLRIILRWLWMILCVVAAWVVILIPVILFDTWLQSATSFSIVSLVMLVLSSLTIVWVSSYIYLLYRKVVSEDASKA